MDGCNPHRKTRGALASFPPRTCLARGARGAGGTRGADGTSGASGASGTSYARLSILAVLPIDPGLALRPCCPRGPVLAVLSCRSRRPLR